MSVGLSRKHPCLEEMEMWDLDDEKDFFAPGQFSDAEDDESLKNLAGLCKVQETRKEEVLAEPDTDDIDTILENLHFQNEDSLVEEKCPGAATREEKLFNITWPCDRFSKKQEIQVSENGKPCTIEELEYNFNHDHKEQRYQLVVMVTSRAWLKNRKISVWVEDPTDHGITILCSFAKSFCEKLLQDSFLEINCQYLVTNAMIDLNRTKVSPTFAKHQILLTEESKIERVKDDKRLPVFYRPLALADLKQTLSKDPPGSHADIIAIPIEDLGIKSENGPRKLKLIDDSGGEIIWSLWDNDTINDKAIEKIMNRPVLIRNGVVDFFNGVWQVRKELCSVRLDTGAIAKMQDLQDWFATLERA